MFRFSSPLARCCLRPYSTAPSEDLVLRLRNAMKESMRARDTSRTQTLKSALGDIQTAEKLPSAPSPLKTLQKSIKKREDAISTLPAELQRQYRSEIDVLSPFASSGAAEPVLDLEQLQEVAATLFKDLGEGRTMGALVKAVRERLPDVAGKDVALTVKKLFQTKP